MKYTACAPVLALTLFSCGDAFAAPALKQQSRNSASPIMVRLTPDQASDFDGALSRIAAQGKVCIVVEGEPMQSKRAPGKTPLLASETPLPVALKRVAEAFGYEAAEKTGGWVLKKRYDDPRDLPGVTLEECRASLEDVERILAVPLHLTDPQRRPNLRSIPAGNYAADLVSSLSADHLSALQQGNLRAADLGLPQKEALRALAISTYLRGVLGFFRESLFLLKHAPQMTLRMSDWQGRKVFGYEFVAADGQTAFRPLEIREAQEEGVPPAVTAETAQRESSAQEAPTPPSATLAAVAAELTARPQAPRLRVDTALGPKPIRVFGAERRSPRQVFNALADVYGLRVSVGGPLDGLRLTRRTARSESARMTDLPAAARRALPEPLLRALHEKEYAAGRGNVPPPQPPADLSPAEREEWLRTENLKRFQSQRWVQGIPRALANEAIHRLRREAEPRLKKGGEEATGLPVSSLSDAGRTAFALVLMEGFLDTLRSELIEEKLGFADQVENMRLSGAMTRDAKGIPRLAIQFSVIDPQTNRVQSSGGVSNVNFAK